MPLVHMEDIGEKKHVLKNMTSSLQILATRSSITPVLFFFYSPNSGGSCCGGGGGGGGSTGISQLDAFIFLGALAFAVAFLNSQIAAILGKKRKRRKKRSAEMEFSSLNLSKTFFSFTK